MTQRTVRSESAGQGRDKHGLHRSGRDMSDAGSDGRRPRFLALPVDLGCSPRYLDDAEMDRLLEGVTTEAYGHGREDEKTALAMGFKLLLSACRKWRRLDGSNQLAEVI